MIGMSDISRRTDGEIFCDTAADKANLAQFAADHNLQQGTSCLVIDTGEILVLKSDGTWKSL